MPVATPASNTSVYTQKANLLCSSEFQLFPAQYCSRKATVKTCTSPLTVPSPISGFKYGTRNHAVPSVMKIPLQCQLHPVIASGTSIDQPVIKKPIGIQIKYRVA